MKNNKFSEIRNYRPFPFICIFAKTIEGIIYKNIYSYVNKYITSSQRGFMHDSSTVTNLACFPRRTNERGQVDVAHPDAQKAFNQNVDFV